jgi:arylsulfatase A-like enzyme
MPDLLLVPHPGLAVVRKIRGGQPVRWHPERRRGGTHRVEGILVANGPVIRAGGKVEATMADIAPTLLAALGSRVPADMEGQVLLNLFETEPRVEYEEARAAKRLEHDEVYSQAEKEALTRRLSDLGYLE